MFETQGEEVEEDNIEVGLAADQAAWPVMICETCSLVNLSLVESCMREAALLEMWRDMFGG